MPYSPSDIEKKWQTTWAEHKLYAAKDNDPRPKKFVLVEFPYPSGDGLHVGHCRSYTALDIVSRKARMQGHNVLFPIGFDAFGLPTENYAIKHKIHPRIATDQNIANFTRQLKSMGFSFDWDRVVDTTDTEYYRWTQWIFLQLHKQGLAYQDDIAINWCPKCKIGLANEEVVQGNCERCGTPTERRQKKQWMLAITKYAERLLNDLDTVDYLPRIKTQQQNWIGKSEGAEVDFSLENISEKITVYTTRIDTLYSAAFIVLAPEHPLVSTFTTPDQHSAIQEYITATQQKTDFTRQSTQEKTGVFTGSYAINPINNQKIPIWIGDFVIGSYGTGAVFGDAHDERDFIFANKYHIPLTVSVRPEGEHHWHKVQALEECYTDDGILINSGEFDGLTSAEARTRITAHLAATGAAKLKLNYKLRDWVFSRQRYWGEPIPMVHCEQCGVVPLPEDQLPLTLPHVESYEPTDTGESPLAALTDWVNTTCPQCGNPAKRETDTMPNWAGSSWYFLRYTDPKNTQALAAREKLDYWTPVDLYNGGMEHTVLHLLYSRFWHKFLYDIGVVPTPEPYAKRISHGMILASDNEKMSKSRGNVVNPDAVVAEYGADTLRMYEMFIGPFDQALPWNERGLLGIRRFLDKVWRLYEKPLTDAPIDTLTRLLHKTIKKVTEDIDTFSFNTAVSTLMIFVNEATNHEAFPRDIATTFLTLLAPFAPHLTEELWHEILKNTTSIHQEPWPIYDPALTIDDQLTIAIQINGKLRDTIVVPADTPDAELLTLAKASEKVQAHLAGKELKKEIVVPKKLVSFVVA